MVFKAGQFGTWTHTLYSLIAQFTSPVRQIFMFSQTPYISDMPWLKVIIWETGVLRRTVVGDWFFYECGSHRQSRVETSVANKSPFYDSSHPDNNFQSKYVIPRFKLFSYNSDMPRLVKRICSSSSHESYWAKWKGIRMVLCSIRRGIIRMFLLALQWSSYLVSSSKESSSLSSSPSLGKSSCDFLEAKKSGNLKKREELLSNINHELSVCLLSWIYAFPLHRRRFHHSSQYLNFFWMKRSEEITDKRLWFDCFEILVQIIR